ncbi:hypothetical protein FSP39_007072 [Pinctada imbricata]|uniref:G-protein coupled receptors family 1 profile domain-containing protein n=1 Tax=Pinctada imbricata TaxID=66713 RepID=A0AA88XVQ8_PINIB|nr:hypothetical protein FSP39_007072 [Pinctada imbricata]
MNVTESSVPSSILENCTGSCNFSMTEGDDVAETVHPVIVVLNYVNYVILPVFLVLGLTGNTLTILAMNTKRFANQTSRLFLTALSLSDSVLLLTQPFNKLFVINILGMDLRALTDVGCKAFFVIFKTAKMTSSWFVVFLCLERFVAVWFPMKLKSIFTRTVALVGIAVVYLVIGTYTSVWSYASQIVDGKVCHPDVYDKKDAYEVQRFGRFITTGLAIYSMIPIAILLVITPMIIIKLVVRAKAMRKMTNKTNKKAETKTTAMLLGVMVAYILLIVPVTCLHMSAFVLRLNAFGRSSLGFMIFREVSQILEQINYAINFFLYVLSSSSFRGALTDVVCFKAIAFFRRK